MSTSHASIPDQVTPATDVGSARAEGAGNRLLTVQEVAEMLHVPVSWVYERTRKRSTERIPGFRLGKYWRFSEVDVLAWIQRQRLEMSRRL
jgi:excisionase family DNA binding protein